MFRSREVPVQVVGYAVTFMRNFFDERRIGTNHIWRSRSLCSRLTWLPLMAIIGLCEYDGLWIG